MKMLSLRPDKDMEWIYSPSHRDYYTDHAEHLRQARAAAIRSAHQWMVELARFNDAMREAEESKRRPVR